MLHSIRSNFVFKQLGTYCELMLLLQISSNVWIISNDNNEHNYNKS